MENNSTSSENIVTDLFDSYQDTQKEVLQIKLRKTRNTLLIMAVIFFIVDFLTLSIADALTGATFIYIILYPVIFVGLAFLALKEPLLAMIIAAVLIAGLWGYVIYLNGATAIITGWLVKAVVIYFVIAGFQSAAEANSIRRELKG